MKRKRSATAKPLPRKRLKTIEEKIDEPSRPDPTHVKVGLKKDFKAWELRKLGAGIVDKISDNTWLVIYSGPGYIDIDRCAVKKSAQSVVSMFKLRYPSVKVEWLKGDHNASADNAARGADSKTRARADDKVAKWQRNLSQRRAKQSTKGRKRKS